MTFRKNCMKNKYVVSVRDISLILLTLKSLYGFSLFYYNELVDNILLIGALGLGILVMFNKGYTVKQLVCYVAIGICLFVSCMLVGEWYLLITYVSIVLIADTNFDSAVRVICHTQFAYLFINILISIPFYSIDRDLVVTDYYGEIRWHFMMSHPNVFSMVYMAVAIEWLWLNWRKTDFRKIIVWCSAIFLCYYFTRADVILLIVAIVIIALIDNKYLHKVYELIAKYGILALTGVSFFMTYCYCNNVGIISIFVQWLDIILSRRIAILAMTMSLNKVRLFDFGMKTFEGYNQQFQIFGVKAIDNAYFSIIYNYGFVYIILLSVLFFLIARNHNKKANMLLVIFIMYGFIEGQIVISLIFPTLLLISLLIGKKNNSFLKTESYQSEWRKNA